MHDLTYSTFSVRLGPFSRSLIHCRALCCFRTLIEMKINLGGHPLIAFGFLLSP